MCLAVLSGIFLWPSEPAAGRGEPEVSEVLERGGNGRCILVIFTEQGMWPVSSANDVAESKRGGCLLLGTSVPKAGTSKVPLYLQPA